MSDQTEKLRRNLEKEIAQEHPNIDSDDCTNMAYGALSYLAVASTQGNEFAIKRIKQLAEIEVPA